jgi:hypothetical protein
MAKRYRVTLTAKEQDALERMISRAFLRASLAGTGSMPLASMDQLNTHAPASLHETFPPEEAKRLADRLEIHHTPKHGSPAGLIGPACCAVGSAKGRSKGRWLNMAETEFSALTHGLPERVGDRLTLERHVRAWQQARNEAEVTPTGGSPPLTPGSGSASSTR